MSDSEDIKNIKDIKNEKKLKKQLSPEALLVRQQNAQKARAARDAKVEQKNKVKLIESNISNLINQNISDDDEYEYVKPSKLTKEIKIEEAKQSATNSNIPNDDYRLLLDHLTNINKKVEKLYTMKKYKNKDIKTVPQPVYINNKSTSDDLLAAIRNKMLNS